MHSASTSRGCAPPPPGTRASTPQAHRSGARPSERPWPRVQTTNSRPISSCWIGKVDAPAYGARPPSIPYERSRAEHLRAPCGCPISDTAGGFSSRNQRVQNAPIPTHRGGRNAIRCNQRPDPGRATCMPWSNQSGGGRRGGGGGGPWGQGPSGGPHHQPDLEELLKRSQDKLKQVMPGGAGLPGSFMFLIAVVVAAIVAFYAFTFKVGPDELGVVMQFGKPVRSEPPGLHFRLPYPIEEVRLPKVTRQNIIEVGMRTGQGARGFGAVRDVPEES